MRRRWVIVAIGALTTCNAICVIFSLAFVLEDGVVYHAYSTYARGLDGLWGMYQWLDRAPKGRNEARPWWRRHDEYEQG